MGAQEALSNALGLSRARRIDTVVTMLENNARRAPGYWLQLVLATGIATLGLVLGSTAVVIGGMLVSPLMGPIVELGMGLAVGSSLLVFRSFLRVALSVGGVIVAAALLTIALPFHEVTSEIASRTAPTLLDLLVAVFCALAAAYTTVRQTADTTAAAAGTAIGIALVPPLCVTGFGIGTGTPSVAGGAALLFTANFSAILLLAVLSFLLLGYNQVDAEALEHGHLDSLHTRSDHAAGRIQHALRRAFGSRFGLAMRLLVPLAILSLVAVPLKRALDEVAWEVRVRDVVRRTLAAESVRAVQSALEISHHTVSLRLILIGSPERAAALQRRLVTRIAETAEVAPAVIVSAVPDAAVLATTLASERQSAAARTPPVDLSSAQRIVGVALDAAWPAEASGRLIGWSLEVDAHGASRLSTRHVGPPLGAAAEQMLSRAAATALGTAPVIVDVALPREAVIARSETDSEWLDVALAAINRASAADSATACVTRPRRGTRRNGGNLGPLSRAGVERALRSASDSRGGLLTIGDSTTWSLRFSEGPCVAAADSQAAAVGRTGTAPR